MTLDDEGIPWPAHEAQQASAQQGGYAGLDSRGRMVLWATGFDEPFLFGPSTDERFAWRDVIGGD